MLASLTCLVEKDKQLILMYLDSLFANEVLKKMEYNLAEIKKKNEEI